MPLPPNLLQMAEEHACFSGVWRHDASAECITDPTQPARSIAVLHCADCLTHHLAVDLALVPPGMDSWSLAADLTAHVRRHRGYSISLGGYHTAGPGFWLSAAYWAQLGVFILSSRGSGPPLDVLIEAIKHGLVAVPDPRMSQASLYTVHDVYLSVVPPPLVGSVGALLASSHVSAKPKAGFKQVTLAGFDPIAQPVIRRSKSLPAGRRVPQLAPPKPVTPRKLGDVCPVCGETVSVRPLLHSTYVGCRCG